jgi:hypothetical protein
VNATVPIPKRYRPKTVEEGSLFLDIYCDHCHRFVDCEIVVRSMCKYIDDPNYPPQLRVYDGEPPYCTDFIQKNGTGGPGIRR